MEVFRSKLNFFIDFDGYYRLNWRGLAQIEIYFQ